MHIKTLIDNSFYSRARFTKLTNDEASKLLIKNLSYGRNCQSPVDHRKGYTHVGLEAMTRRNKFDICGFFLVSFGKLC